MSWRTRAAKLAVEFGEDVVRRVADLLPEDATVKEARAAAKRAATRQAAPAPRRAAAAPKTLAAKPAAKVTPARPKAKPKRTSDLAVKPKTIPVYHGTTRDFEVFDPSRARAGLGVYVTPNREFAQEFAQDEGRILEGQLASDNIIDLSGFGAFPEKSKVAAIAKQVGADPKELSRTYNDLAKQQGDVHMFSLLENAGVEIPEKTAWRFEDWGQGAPEPAYVFSDVSLFSKNAPKQPAAPLAVQSETAPTARPEVLIGAESPFMVSTRRPSQPNYAVHGNPDEELLVQSGDALRAAPQAYEKNMKMLTEEPFMAGVSATDPDAIYQEALKRGSDNLSFIVNDLMDPERAAATKEWYPAAQMISERAAARAGLPPQAGYGVTAVTSPQTPWDINVARLDRLMDMYGDRFAVDPADARRYVQGRLDLRNPGAVAARGPEYAERIAATPYEELTDKFDKFARVSLADATRNDPMVRRIGLSGEYGEPYGGMTWGSGDSISKALSIMDDPSMENINAQLLGGGKVPSFYNNIAEPNSAAPIVTIDTHSAGASSLFPGGGNDPIVYRAMGLGPSGKGLPPAAADAARTGSKGLYGPLADMHVLAGEQLGMLPREVQSATWEGVRDLWGQEGKTPALKQAISDIWRTSSTPDEARFRIADLLGRPVRRMFQVKP